MSTLREVIHENVREGELYEKLDPENTSAETLMRAAEIGKRSGLHYVYTGNLPGMVGD